MAIKENKNLIGSLTESLEDYLEIIFRLLQENKVARVRDIALAKDVKTSSVTSALQRLAKAGYVDYQAREYVDLTDAGREFAFRLNQRHIFLKRFLTDLLQVDEETAEKDACSVEHAISLSTLERISAFTEYISFCPKVDDSLISEFRDCWLTGTEDLADTSHQIPCGIWMEKGELSAKLGIKPLTDLEAGEGGTVSRIIGPESTRRNLIQRGILPATSILLDIKHEDAGFVLQIEGEEITLTSEEADMVFVWSERNIPTDSNDSNYPRLSLAHIAPGEHFKVVRLDASGEIRQRLLDMGFIKGARGRLLREALLRDPIEVELNGYHLSLRRMEAADILIESTVATPVS